MLFYGFPLFIPIILCYPSIPLLQFSYFYLLSAPTSLVRPPSLTQWTASTPTRLHKKKRTQDPTLPRRTYPLIILYPQFGSNTLLINDWSFPFPLFSNYSISLLPLSTKVQHVSFVGSTNEDCHPHPLCNLQNLHVVPPYFHSLYACFIR